MKLQIRIERLVVSDGLLGERDLEAFRRSLHTELGRLLVGRSAGAIAGADQRRLGSLSTTVAASAGEVNRLGQGIATTISRALR